MLAEFLLKSPSLGGFPLEEGLPSVVSLLSEEGVCAGIAALGFTAAVSPAGLTAPSASSSSSSSSSAKSPSTSSRRSAFLAGETGELGSRAALPQPRLDAFPPRAATGRSGGSVSGSCLFFLPWFLVGPCRAASLLCSPCPTPSKDTCLCCCCWKECVGSSSPPVRFLHTVLAPPRS